MYTILIIIIVIASILLGLVVLMQNSKGGGLSSTFASSSQIMGVRKTADFLEKATWYLAIGIVVLSFVSSFLTGGSTSDVERQQGSKASQAQSTEPMAIPTATPTATPIQE